MPINSIFKQFEQHATTTLAWLHEHMQTLRTGRVTTATVSHVPVEHYGARTPLNGVATLSLLDARTILISPWDVAAVPAIEKALLQANVGATPVVDGKAVRLSFPMLNEEMRKVSVKKLHQQAEEARVKLRRSRDDLLAVLKKERQASTISEDEFYGGKEGLDQRIGQANEQILSLVAAKEEELRTL